MKAEITKDVRRAADYLKRGELVAIPTETVYGLAANAFDDEAVQKIFAAKERPSYDPLIVHTHDPSNISKFAVFENKNARQLAAAYWPGPLTFVLPKKELISDLVTAGLSTVGIRIPNHPLTLALLEEVPFPIAAPSANPFGYVSPTTAEHVLHQLGDRIACILDGGPCAVGLESTIVGFNNGHGVIYRYGGLEVEQIESVIGPVEISINVSANPLAPGMMKRHYSPANDIVVGDPAAISKARKGTFAVLSFSEKYQELGASEVFTLSQKGDLQEAAHRLFLGLRYLDSLQVDYIIAELVPSKGLGHAINDRIRRAAAH